MEWHATTIEQCCNLVNGRAFKPSEWSDHGLPIIRIQNLNDSSKPFNCFDKVLPEKYAVKAGDILLSWSGTPGTSFGCFRWNGPNGWLNQHIFRVELEPYVDANFFVYHINAVLSQLIERAHGGVGLSHITKKDLNKIGLKLPSLSEQCRIVEVLDQAESLRKKRAKADEIGHRILPALFYKMFGDPIANSKGATIESFGEVVNGQMRNGLSPCSNGSHVEDVLTLSAVTGTTFVPSARKQGAFSRRPGANQRVAHGAFLICRGNGNRDLVGTAKFAEGEAPGVVFPDTIIGVDLQGSDVNGRYLEALWKTPSFRQRIASIAKTTSGIYKVSQQGLATLPIPVPPIDLQTAFANAEARNRANSSLARNSARTLDSLIRILLHRAFSGDLTAKWREAHMHELLLEMEQQAKALELD